MSLVDDFEAGTVDPAAFGHREHLSVAWCYLKDLSLEDALARYVKHLRALTHRLGVPQKFHATITWTFMILLHEAMQAEPELAFEMLLARRPELLDKRTLLRFYDQAQLDSAEARERYVLPHQAFTSSKRETRGTPGRLARKRAP
jgi:hypothetical protein